MLAALAFLAVAFIRVPVVLFLQYEPKDVIVSIAGFMFGPLSCVIMSLVLSFTEMVTISETGIIGCVMNVLSTCAFCCPAAFIYKKRRTARGAAVGLVIGIIAVTAVMMLWNYLITPLYMEISRAEVAKLLVPAFLPFNLIKGSLNCALVMLLYKPVVTALRQAKLLPPSPVAPAGGKKRATAIIAAASAVVIIICILLVLKLNGTL